MIRTGRNMIHGVTGLSNVLLIRPEDAESQEMRHRRTRVFPSSNFCSTSSGHLWSQQPRSESKYWLVVRCLDQNNRIQSHASAFPPEDWANISDAVRFFLFVLSNAAWLLAVCDEHDKCFLTFFSPRVLAESTLENMSERMKCGSISC